MYESSATGTSIDSARWDLFLKTKKRGKRES